jgi:two-component system sensor histidine kinase SenX3
VTVLVAIAVTAVVVAAATAAWIRRTTRDAIASAIGARPGANPVEEHRRLLAEASERADGADARARLLDLALDGLASGVVITDGAGTVIVRNQVAGEMSAQSHVQTLVEAACDELAATALQGESAERELEVSGPPPRTLLLQAAPIRGHGGVDGTLVVFDDVTDSRRIDSTRRDFVANLSHELRTPIGAISLLSEMLADEDDGDTRATLTERLVIETGRMSDTIDGLLELSRIESNSQSYDDAVVVQRLLDDAVARTRVAAESKSVTVTTVLGSETLAMRGNADQLLSAVVNLVENAIKYSDPGDRVTVRAGLGGEPGGSRQVVIKVQDTGRGIPQRDLDRIFERFYRVDRSRDSETGGTGIGLSIVRHVALNHGGSVDVESFEGDGSTFTISVPLAEDPK